MTAGTHKRQHTVQEQGPQQDMRSVIGKEKNPPKTKERPLLEENTQQILTRTTVK